jgi:outer membrane protein W
MGTNDQWVNEEELPLQKNHKFKIIKNYTETQLKKLGYTGNSWEELIDHFFSENLDYKIQGIVIYNKRGERTKMRSSNYEKVKHLKGNSPKLQYRYYQLRQQGVVKDFLKYYPEYKEEFFNFRNELHKWTNQLYQNYINCFIKRQKPLAGFPYNFKTHMYKIHEIYLFDLKSDQKYVNKSVVIDYVNNLPPAKLMYSVNHIKKQFDKERKIVTSDLKVLMKVE